MSMEMCLRYMMLQASRRKAQKDSVLRTRTAEINQRKEERRRRRNRGWRLQ